MTLQNCTNELISVGAVRRARTTMGARGLSVAVTLLVLWALVAAPPEPWGARAPAPAPASSSGAPPQMSGFFTENGGQLRNSEIRYYFPSDRLSIGFSDSAVWFAVRRPVI